MGIPGCALAAIAYRRAPIARKVVGSRVEQVAVKVERSQFVRSRVTPEVEGSGEEGEAMAMKTAMRTTG